MIQEFFPKRSDFPEDDKNWISFVFTVLPKHTEMKLPLKCKSVCGPVVKKSRFNPALTS